MTKRVAVVVVVKYTLAAPCNLPFWLTHWYFIIFSPSSLLNLLSVLILATPPSSLLTTLFESLLTTLFESLLTTLSVCLGQIHLRWTGLLMLRTEPFEAIIPANLRLRKSNVSALRVSIPFAALWFRNSALHRQKTHSFVGVFRFPIESRPSASTPSPLISNDITSRRSKDPSKVSHCVTLRVTLFVLSILLSPTARRYAPRVLTSRLVSQSLCVPSGHYAPSLMCNH